MCFEVKINPFKAFQLIICSILSTSEQHRHMLVSFSGTLSLSNESQWQTSVCSFYGLKVDSKTSIAVPCTTLPGGRLYANFRFQRWWNWGPRRFHDSPKGQQTKWHLSQNENSSFCVFNVRLTECWCFSFLYKVVLCIRDFKEEHICRYPV